MGVGACLVFHVCQIGHWFREEQRRGESLGQFSCGLPAQPERGLGTTVEVARVEKSADDTATAD